MQVQRGYNTVDEQSLTVPSSMYTAVPHAATTAPNSHMTSDNPTLPDDRRMTLGVAKMLDEWQQVVSLGVQA